MLSDTACRSAKPKDKPYKLADERGLYLLVNSAGRYWRFDYRFDGKRQTLALGTYPERGLKDAREARDEARRLLQQGVNPSQQRRAQKRARGAGDSFEAVAREWHAKFIGQWTADHAARILRRLELDVFPWIGARPIGELDAADMLEVIQRIEARGVIQTAHRALQNCGQVFRYAVATRRAKGDPTRDLRGALTPVNEEHHASITDPKEIAELLRAIDGYKGEFVTRCALRMAPLVFVRPTELRHMEWTEIEGDQWRIPAAKMKMRQVHIVPLSRQALAVLDEIRPLTGAGQYVFPSARGKGRPMSEGAVLSALQRMGYGETMTGHGFRSMASTRLHEMQWPHHLIERQLAHGERNKSAAAYNYAEHLPERRAMMQAWADYLDGLR